MNNKLYATFASLVGARLRCAQANNTEWFAKHSERIEELLDEMPSGSGFDCGTKLDLDASTEDKLVFTTSFHHMNDAGMYDGWTEHRVIVTPSLALKYRLAISGRDRNGIKEYIADVFAMALNEPTPMYETTQAPTSTAANNDGHESGVV